MTFLLDLSAKKTFEKMRVSCSSSSWWMVAKTLQQCDTLNFWQFAENSAESIEMARWFISYWNRIDEFVTCKIHDSWTRIVHWYNLHTHINMRWYTEQQCVIVLKAVYWIVFMKFVFYTANVCLEILRIPQFNSIFDIQIYQNSIFFISGPLPSLLGIE